VNGWSWKDYLRARQQFVQARQYRVSTMGVALVFTVTWLAGWAASASLLRWGHVTGMGLRYAVSAAVAYAVFFAAMRVWAEFQRGNPSERSGLDDLASGPPDFWGFDGGEGCLIALAISLISLLAAVLLGVFGGFAALLEVAFEVAFAGVVVRRAFAPNIVVGRWWQTLLRRTALPALIIAALLVALAAQVQTWFPQSHTLGQAMSQWLHERQGAQD
jgi:hypothetical protein